MSALEQSLDSIIAANKKPTKPRKQVAAKKASKPQTRVGKATAVSKKSNRPKAPSAITQKATVSSPIDWATKVAVYGLPSGIKPHSVKEFFETVVGKIRSVQLAYNEKGKFIGNATVVFASAKAAQLAVAKYNDSPIDGGKSTLKMELIVDPTKRPLVDRIQPNNLTTGPAKKSSAAAQKVRQKVKQQQQTSAKNGRGKIGVERKKAASAAPKRNARPKKKSLAELDQEMADYFTTNEAN